MPKRPPGACRCWAVPFVLASIASLGAAPSASGQVRYVARFTLEKQSYLAGEPVFCKFTVENTGTQPIAFSYRTPSRVLNPELESEPRFAVRDERGRAPVDPAPRPCGGAKGSVVYGSVSLPPGQIHTERWLLNQWARLARPGRYTLKAERRLPLLGVDLAAQQFSVVPVAYALAANELSFEVAPATEAQLEAAFRPYLETVRKPKAASAEVSEAAMVLVTLPRPSFLPALMTLASAPPKEGRWDREKALAGLARLGTREAWDAILRIARQGISSAAASERNLSLRAYAVLLLGEKGDARFVSPLLQMLSSAPESLRNDVLRSRGLLNHPRANQALFEKMHSPRADDRVNAILGLRNLGIKETIPPLLAMLNDPEARVRQVADFALAGLTGCKPGLAAGATHAESAQVAADWNAWWQEHSASFTPLRQPACRDW